MRTTDVTPRAQTTVVYLAIAALLVLGAGALVVYVFAGAGPAPSADDGTPPSTSTPGATVAPTATAPPTLSPTPTLTPTPPLASTATGTPPPTATPASTPNTSAYRPFVREYLLKLDEVGTDLNVTVELRGSRFYDGELWVVFDLADPSGRFDRRTSQLTTALNAYWKAYNAHIVGKIGGEAPDSYRVLEVDNTQTAAKMSSMNSSLLDRHASEEIPQEVVVDAFADRYRNQTTRERKRAREIDREGRNVTVGDTDGR